MPDWLNFLDFLFVLVMVLSGIFAYVRGFTKEMFAISSWFIAAFLVKFLFPLLEPLVISGFGGEGSIWSSTVTYSVSFFLCIVLISFFANKLSRRIGDSDLKNVDKSLGVVFGIVRGVFIMAIFYISVLWFISDPAKKPSWMKKEAKSAPAIKYSVHLVSKLFPESEDFDRIKNILEGEDEGFDMNKMVGKNLGNTGMLIKNLKDVEKYGDLGIAVENDSADFDSMFNNITKETTYTEEEIKNLEDYLKKIDKLDKIEGEFLK